MAKLEDKVIATIKVSIEKTLDTMPAQEASDIQHADFDALRLLGYRVTGYSFMYDEDFEREAEHG